MIRGLNLLIVIFVLGTISCSDDSAVQDHLLIGDYLGSWEFHTIIETKFSIEYEEENDGLVLFFTLADSSDLNIISDTEFDIDRYEQYGYSNYISGKLVEDTLYLQNEIFLVSDQMNTENLRTGTFVKQY